MGWVLGCPENTQLCRGCLLKPRQMHPRDSQGRPGRWPPLQGLSPLGSCQLTLLASILVACLTACLLVSAAMCVSVCVHACCPVGRGHECVWMEMGLSLGLPARPYFSLLSSLGLLLVREALCTSFIEPLSSAEGRYFLC